MYKDLSVILFQSALKQRNIISLKPVYNAHNLV